MAMASDLGAREIITYDLSASMVIATKTVMVGAPSSRERALVPRVQRDSMGAWEWIDTERKGDSRIERSER